MILISVIICTYNRSESLRITLESLLHQESHGAFEYEVMLVDNNSTDATRTVVEEFVQRFNGKLRHFFQPISGKTLSMNMALARVTGEIIAFTDDDVVLDPVWLYELNQCFLEFDCDGVGGRVLPVYPAGTPQWIKDNAIKLAGAVVIYDFGETTKPLHKDMLPFIGCNFAFRRQMFNEYGLFNEDLGPGAKALGEDIEFVERLLSQGRKLYYCGKAVVNHPYDLKRFNWQKLARWHIALGRSEAQREIRNHDIKVTYFGIPRYLLRGVVLDFVKIIVNFFNRLERWNAWRSFFRKVGMILQYSINQVSAK